MDITVHTKYSIGQKLYQLVGTKIKTYYIASLEVTTLYHARQKEFTQDVMYHIMSEDEYETKDARGYTGVCPSCRLTIESDLERQYFTSKADILKELAEQLADD